MTLELQYETIKEGDPGPNNVLIGVRMNQVSQETKIVNGYQVVETIYKDEKGQFVASWTCGGWSAQSSPLDSQEEARKSVQTTFDMTHPAPSV